MLQELWAIMNTALGLDLEAHQINVWQMSLRALVVFILAIFMVRIGDKRFMGKHTALDVMLGIVFGSVVSRAISGNAPFFPTLAAGAVLVIAHWILAAIAFRSHRFGALVKGRDSILVQDGKLQHEELKRAHVTEGDLKESMRESGKWPDLRSIRSAHLERDGDISIIVRDKG